jgi:hypothetical protein
MAAAIAIYGLKLFSDIFGIPNHSVVFARKS